VGSISGSPKVCVVCGTDCSHKPRTKDPQGRYYCTECYTEASHSREAGDEPGSPLDELIAAAAPPPARSAECPRCGRPMAAGAALCTNCGYSAAGAPPIATSVFGAPPSQRTASGGIRMALMAVVWPDWLFRNFAITAPGVLIVLICYAFGVVEASARIDLRLMTGSARGSNAISFIDRWEVYWGISVVSGAICALAIAVINGWWYRKRLQWSGDSEAELGLARRVLFTSALIYVIPALIQMFYVSATYDTPIDAVHSELTAIDFVVVLTPLLSIWLSFVGVRSVFETRLAPAIVWFIVVPGVYYLIAIIGFAVFFTLAASGMLFPSPTPDVVHYKIHRSQTMKFHYPGNWSMRTDAPDHDPNAYVWIESLGGASVEVRLYESDASAAMQVQFSADHIEAGFDGWKVGASFDRWGRFSGTGRRYRGQSAGQHVHVSIFVAEIEPGMRFEVIESCRLDEVGKLVDGFELLRNSAEILGPPS